MASSATTRSRANEHPAYCLTAHCPLPTAHCPLPTATAHCPLPTGSRNRGRISLRGRSARRAPCVVTTFESGDVGEAVPFEDERRPGARFFVGSRTVRDDRFVLRQE